MKYKVKAFDNKDREKAVADMNKWFETVDIEIAHLSQYFRNDRQKWYFFIYYTEGEK